MMGANFSVGFVKDENTKTVPNKSHLDEKDSFIRGFNSTTGTTLKRDLDFERFYIKFTATSPPKMKCA